MRENNSLKLIYFILAQIFKKYINNIFSSDHGRLTDLRLVYLMLKNQNKTKQNSL